MHPLQPGHAHCFLKTNLKFDTVHSLMATEHYPLIFVGRAIGRAVPSINPQQFGSAALFASTAREKVSVSSQTKSKDVKRSLNSSYTVFISYKMIK